MSKETSIKELSQIIVKAINDEPYFQKDVLIPKIQALIKGFRLRMATNNYEKIGNKTQMSNLIRANELYNIEKEYWKQELKNIVGEEKIKEYYKKLDEILGI